MGLTDSLQWVHLRRSFSEEWSRRSRCRRLQQRGAEQRSTVSLVPDVAEVASTNQRRPTGSGLLPRQVGWQGQRGAAWTPKCW
jgi:hypothetical protein